MYIKPKLNLIKRNIGRACEYIESINQFAMATEDQKTVSLVPKDVTPLESNETDETTSQASSDGCHVEYSDDPEYSCEQSDKNDIKTTHCWDEVRRTIQFPENVQALMDELSGCGMKNIPYHTSYSKFLYKNGKYRAVYFHNDTQDRKPRVIVWRKEKDGVAIIVGHSKYLYDDHYTIWQQDHHCNIDPAVYARMLTEIAPF